MKVGQRRFERTRPSKMAERWGGKWGKFVSSKESPDNTKWTVKDILSSLMKAGRKVLVWIAAVLADRTCCSLWWEKVVVMCNVSKRHGEKGSKYPSPLKHYWQKNYRPTIKLWLFEKKRKCSFLQPLFKRDYWKCFSLCWATACRDTCVISLSGMATTMGFLQMFHFMLALKNKAPKMFLFPFITKNAYLTN